MVRHLIKIKLCCIAILIFGIKLNSYSQESATCWDYFKEFKIPKSKDTVTFKISLIDSFKKDLTFSCRPHCMFYINDSLVDSTEFNRADRELQYANDFLRQASCNYCKVYYDNGNVCQEGIFLFEIGMIGYTKRYYESGIIMEEGNFSTNNCYPAQKVGAWKCYNEKGSLIKEEVYSKEGKLLSSKKPKKVQAKGTSNKPKQQPKKSSTKTK